MTTLAVVVVLLLIRGARIDGGTLLQDGGGLLGFLGREDVFEPLIWVLAAASMTIGNLIALRQTNIVRLLAYSGVAQGGFMLVPFAVAGLGAAALIWSIEWVSHGVDWLVDIGTVRERVGDQVALQGNMDPTCLFLPPEGIRERVKSGIGERVKSGLLMGRGKEVHEEPQEEEGLMEKRTRKKRNREPKHHRDIHS